MALLKRNLRGRSRRSGCRILRQWADGIRIGFRAGQLQRVALAIALACRPE